MPTVLAVGMGWIDWGVVLAYFVVTTLVGHLLSGKQDSMDDFFLGGNKLPWYAVAGSMIATEISAITFVGVPAIVFGVGGNFTYLQLGLIAGLLARLFIAWVLIPAYYKQRIFSPYDYMGNQLGGGVRGVMTTLFSVGGVLAQASRVYLTAVILELVLAGPFGWVEAHLHIAPLVSAVVLIGVIAAFWTILGGIATVIWTDVMLFAVFVIGGLVAIFAIAGDLNGGFAELFHIGAAGGKFKLFDLGLDFSPIKEYTVWTAAIGTLFGNIGAYGTDQLLAQRLLCCENQREARKAIIASYFGQAVTALMLLVGVGLWVYHKGAPAMRYETGTELAVTDPDAETIFQRHGVTIEAVEPTITFAVEDMSTNPQISEIRSDGTPVFRLQASPLPPEQWSRPLPPAQAELYEDNHDNIFPLFILSDAIPPGLTGLIIAGIFAAAISSFDSILAALSQTTISAAYLPWLNRRRLRGPTVREGGGAAASRAMTKPPAEGADSVGHPPSRSGLVDGVPEERTAEQEVDSKQIVFVSRILVIFWAVLLCLVAFGIDWYKDKFDLPILVIALGLASMVQGGLLAAFFLAWLPLKINGRGLVWAAPLSVLCVASLQFHDPWANYTTWGASVLLVGSWIAACFTDSARINIRLLKTPILIAGCGLLIWISYYGSFDGVPLAWPWWALVGGIVAFVWGYLLADRRDVEQRGFPVEPMAPVEPVAPAG